MAVGNEIKQIGAKIRLDYKGQSKQGKFLFNNKSNKAADSIREQQAVFLRNIPLQGVVIEEIDLSSDIYYLYDDASRAEFAYAPAVLTVRANALEDLLTFVLRDEFRKIDITDPQVVDMTRYEIEKLFFMSSEKFKNYAAWLDRRYNEK